MGVFDKANEMKEKLADVAEKVEDVTEENVDKLDGLIDKATDKIKEKTGGKHSDAVDSVVEPIQNPVEATAGADEPPSRLAP